MFVENSKKFFEHSKLNSAMWATIGKLPHWWAALVDTGKAGTSPVRPRWRAHRNWLLQPPSPP